MPDYLYPGVYVDEKSLRTIEGVGTSTAAFVGITDKGPSPGKILPNGRAAQPVMVTSFTDYQRTFGGYRVDSFLSYATKAFFDNGGQRLYIVRVLPADAATACLVTRPAANLRVPNLPIQAANEGVWGNEIWVSVDDSSDGMSNNFQLTVMVGKTAAEARQNVVESYDEVTFKKAGSTEAPSNYVSTIVNDRSEYIAFNSSVEVTARPVNTASPVRLRGGSDGSTGNVDVIGAAAEDTAKKGTGIHALDGNTDVNLIAIPGAGDQLTINKATAYCKYERPLHPCFFVGDAGSISAAQARCDDATTSIGTVGDACTFATSGMDRAAGDFGAVYFPWIWAADPIGTGSSPRILLPPSGFVTGIYARIDSSRGVFRAPAGPGANLIGALAPLVEVSYAEQNQLNPLHINVIRRWPGSGLVVSGARTIGSDVEWRYIPIRRLAIQLETSIRYGIRWTIFEPNDEALWTSLRHSIGVFLVKQFHAGAFAGRKPDEAFFVKCDSSTTTQTDIDNGVVRVLVGFAPLKAGEFVIFSIQRRAGQPAS